MNYKSHYDIANFIYNNEIIKNEFKYDENKSKWFYIDNNKWIEDNETKKLKDIIKTHIINNIINKCLNTPNNYNCIYLLETAIKLKQDKYLKKIINELKQFFY